MIKRMTKYSLILLSSELDSFLDELQSIGMVDITRSIKAVDNESRDMLDLARRYKNAIKNLSAIASSKEQITPLQVDVAPVNLLSTVEEMLRAKTELPLFEIQKNREKDEATLWGEYNKESIDQINNLGYNLHFYSVAENKFNQQWKNDYPLEILNETKGRIYFTILSPKEEEYKFSLQEAKFPEQSASTIDLQIKGIVNQIKENSAKLVGITQQLPLLKEQYNELLTKIDLYFADSAARLEGDDSIAVLIGFAPTDEDAKVSSFLDSSNAYYIKEDAQAEDNPPVKLKNNWFASMFETIGDFYMPPRYDELDLTPYFAPFYMLFFGFCLGDMGYGLILLIIGIIATFFLPKFKKYGKLILFLGIGTIIMPALTGTFFGAKIYDLVTFPDEIKNFFFSDIKLFWFGIIFGLVQLVFARIIHSIDSFKRKNIDEGLSALGWSMLIVVLSFMYAGSQMNKDFLPDIVDKILLYGGLLLILFCSKPDKRFYLRPLKGIISLYDITGLFGDMLSYIRLFGLSTAGGILGLVINSVAMQISGIPYIGWGITVIVLIIGHTAVMALNCLGAFVHPMRLTFVEFYKNANFTGGGRPYNPLKKNK